MQKCNIFSLCCIDNEDNRNIELEVAKVEKDHWSAGDELMHEFKVCIRCEDLAHIMEHSKVNKEASKKFLPYLNLNYISQLSS